jgi:hypothetical protein
MLSTSPDLPCSRMLNLRHNHANRADLLLTLDQWTLRRSRGARGTLGPPGTQAPMPRTNVPLRHAGCSFSVLDVASEPALAARRAAGA